jgi:hypothetical protein
MQFVKYYPLLTGDIFFSGIFCKTDLKNGIMIIDSNFNMKYIASSISTQLGIDLEMFKKLKLDFPLFLLCPSILKFFRISNLKIHNKTNMDGDLNQVVLDFYVPPIIEALMKEITNMRNNAMDSNKLMNDEEISKSLSLHKLKTVKRFSVENISIDKDKLLPSYKAILKSINELYKIGDYDTLNDVLKTMYKFTFSDQKYPLSYKKTHLDFSNFEYTTNHNLLFCDLKIVGNGQANGVDEIFVQDIGLDDLMVQGKNILYQENSVGDDNGSHHENHGKECKIYDGESTIENQDENSLLNKST